MRRRPGRVAADLVVAGDLGFREDGARGEVGMQMDRAQPSLERGDAIHARAQVGVRDRGGAEVWFRMSALRQDLAANAVGVRVPFGEDLPDAGLLFSAGL